MLILRLIDSHVLCCISKLDLCEGGIFSRTIFKSDIELSVYHISCFISVCPVVALSKAKFAENSHCAALSSPYKKAFIFNLLCVLICTVHVYTDGWVFFKTNFLYGTINH